MSTHPHTQALRDLDARLRECLPLPISAAEAYDSFYQEMVADALAATPAAQPEGPTPAGWQPTHKHLKRGTLYAEVARGFLQCVQPPADMSELVAYRDQEGRLWFRPPSEFDDDERFALVPPTAAAPNPAAPAAPADWVKAVQEAYGWLWNINNEPMAPIPMLPEGKAAYQARKPLRDLLTTEQRGEAINAVRATLENMGALPPAVPKPEALGSLLRKPVKSIRDVSAQIPGGCYCPPGTCSAPVIMGRQTPCLRREDPETAAPAAGDHPTAWQEAEKIADVPDVHRALVAFSDDICKDNAIGVVCAVATALSWRPLRTTPTQEPAGQEVSDMLYDAIKEVLLHHRLSYTEGDDAEALPLVDMLCPPGSRDIAKGRDEVTMICDAIYNDEAVCAAIALARASQPAEAGVTDTARLNWLDEQIASGVVTMAFEMDGGVFLDVQPIGEPEQSYREKNDIRAAIDAALSAHASRGGK